MAAANANQKWTIRPPCPRDLGAARHLAGQAVKILAAIPANLADDLADAIFANAPGKSAERRIAQLFQDVRHHGYLFSRWLYAANQKLPVGRNGPSARELMQEGRYQPPPKVAVSDTMQSGCVRELVVRYRRRPIPYGARVVGRKATSSLAVFQLFRNLRDEPQEHLFAVHLDGQSAIQSINHVSIGSMREAAAPISVILRNALLAGAAGLIVVHNHPSGNPAPSSQDYVLIEALKRACDFVQISCIDFLIIGEERYWSASDHLLLNTPTPTLPAQPDHGTRQAQKRSGGKRAAQRGTK